MPRAAGARPKQRKPKPKPAAADSGARRPDPAFWNGKRVLLTGHTGFVGAWTALLLERLGAVVTGLALRPQQQPSLYDQGGVAASLASQLVDLRDRAKVATLMDYSEFDLVLHMAIQTSVPAAVEDPVRAFATNVMGCVNLLETLRRQPGLRAVLAVSADGPTQAGATDPCSVSRQACELAVASYADTYFEPRGVAVGAACGGTVIGGGDYALDRPSAGILRSLEAGDPAAPAPKARGPWRHVLDCAAGYLVHLEALATDPAAPRGLDFGRAPNRHVLRFEDRLPPDEAVAWTAEWARAVAGGGDARRITTDQIAAYEALP